MQVSMLTYKSAVCGLMQSITGDHDSKVRQEGACSLTYSWTDRKDCIDFGFHKVYVLQNCIRRLAMQASFL